MFQIFHTHRLSQPLWSIPDLLQFSCRTTHPRHPPTAAQELNPLGSEMPFI